jgi:hypothetical protein
LGIIETFFTEYYLKLVCYRPTDNSVLDRLFSREI